MIRTIFSVQGFLSVYVKRNFTMVCGT